MMGAAHRPSDEDEKQRRPNPPGECERVLAGRKDPDRETDESRRKARRQRPRLWLVAEAARSGGEQDEARTEREQRRADDLVLWRAGEDREHEHEAEQKPRSDGGKHDEP